MVDIRNFKDNFVDLKVFFIINETLGTLLYFSLLRLNELTSKNFILIKNYKFRLWYW